MKAGLACAALLLITLQYQISKAEDLYWEGEDDASNEFLEVKEEPGVLTHLKRLKRDFNFWNPFSLLPSTSTTPPPSNYESNTEDQDDTLFDNKDDDDHIDGSGASERLDPDIGEKTLRVTFVVMEPFMDDYSNRDSVLFQNFSRTLADAVNQLFEKLPGTQKASLVRIQSRLTDEFSCKVTLDIVTIGYDDTNRITEVLRDHIRKFGQLGSVTVQDAVFSANVVNPGAAFQEICLVNEIQCGDGNCVPMHSRCDGFRDCLDGVDEMGCSFEEDPDIDQVNETIPTNEAFDNERPSPEAQGPRCEDPIPCASSAVTYCPDQVCDNNPDCPLGDDEKNCPEKGVERGDQDFATPPPTTQAPQTPQYDLTTQPPAQVCRPEEFTCDETRCLPMSAKCDGRTDCNDGADESSELCGSSESCGADDFRCYNGKCIEGNKRCDNVFDCPSREDELNCDCAEDEFRCVSDGSCIEGRKRCDSVRNCIDGSDETDCACSSDQWQCDQGNCIKRSKRCDGRVDCPSDRSDERNCIGIGYFKCNSGQYIPETQRCNRHYDCPSGDYSDEQNCPCGNGDFKCNNGHCIPANKRCDRTHDCQDGSDELHCTYGTVCMAYEFQCASGQCVHAESFCNGTVECKDGSDEAKCPCKRGEFGCRDGSCINIALRCNGQKDCSEGEDELNCKCPPGSFTCDQYSSVHCATRCNNKVECDNGEDEEDCEECHHECDNKCLEDDLICNNVPDCSDGSDELNCDNCDGPNDFRCESGECIKASERCNGVQECDDGTDEIACNVTMLPTQAGGCLDGEFKCHDGTCINISFLCDNTADCDDGSDEQNCSWFMARASRSPSTAPCSDNEFTCYDGRCIQLSRRCDNYYDCTDFSDEQNCPSACRSNEFQCTSKQCIPSSYRCNGRIECNDGSDEENCPPDYPYPDPNQSPVETTTSRINDIYVPGRDPYGSERPRYSPYAPSTRRPPGYPPRPDENPTNEGAEDEENEIPTDTPDDRYDPYGTTTPRNDPYRPDNRYPDSGNPRPGYPSPNYPQPGNDPYGGGYQTTSVYYQPGGDPYAGVIYPSTSQPSYPQSGGDQYGGYPSGETGQSGYPQSGNDVTGYPSGGSTAQPGYPQPGNNDPYGNGYPSGSTSNQPGYPVSNSDLYGSGNYPTGGGSGPSGSQPGSDPYGGGSYPSAGSPGQPAYPGSDPYGAGSYPYGQSGYPQSGGPGSGSSVRGGSVPCLQHEWRCENGPCIDERRRCDGHIDCPFDFSDEFDCPPGSPVTLDVKIYPKEQTVRFGGDVVIQCRDEGPLRAPVRWVREGGRPLKPGFMERNGRLELYGVTLSDAGVYLCQTPGYLGQPGSEVRVTLNVEQPRPGSGGPLHSFIHCKPHEATCGNGECIPKKAVCDGKIDCTDRSDEDMCNLNGECEPNQFRCPNSKCVLMSWRCDGDNDCGDNSDEEDCGQPEPGSPCSPVEFACRNHSQCIPRSFHCDGRSDCLDKSDEVGCTVVYISKPPKPTNVRLNPGDTLTLTCEAVGTPTPIITWRLNWGHVPDKCSISSRNGIGTLICPNMQSEDSGAYSCEAINNKGTVFATPDSIVFVSKTDLCPSGYFNSEARSESECIRCFCFGESTQCRSADLFTFNMPTPLGEGGTKLVGVAITPDGEIRTDPSITNHYYYQSLRNGAAVTKLVSYDQNWLGNFHPYLTLPESYNGNQLTSYGGHIKFNIAPHSEAYSPDDSAPSIIIKGRYVTLFHNRVTDSAQDSTVEVRLTPENWQKNSSRGFTPASREDIMMALDQVDMILLRADLNSAGVNITDFTMESAQHINVGLGAASLVEECTCPPGYEGLSCEKCASGYIREKSGPWLGNCVRKPPTCPPGTYGDPASGYACRPCPCPLTNRDNQFARTCSLGPDGNVICDCFPGYEGSNCNYCAPGYEGNPLVIGDSCRLKPTDKCNPIGTRQVRPVDECICKDNVQGRYCDQCTNSSFYLSNDFRHGCAACFCTGVSQQCMSSNLRRKTTSAMFNIPSSVNQVKLYSSFPAALRYTAPKETVDSNVRVMTTKLGLGLEGTDPSNPTVYYWAMPISFSGDKVTAYGGFFNYTLENVPSYFSSQKNNAADVQLISENHLIFQYHGDFQASHEGVLYGSVQFLEKGWQRSDGKGLIREHFLLALADVKAILIKATYAPGDHAILKSASIDTAESGGDGPMALHVEQCVCPPGYIGTSCEDCAPGYTRAGNGLYLELCGLCECNGHSRDCHPETGECYNCMDNTAGPKCELCKDGYELDSYGSCVASEDLTSVCECDPRGESEPCGERLEGLCVCKPNVEGRLCDQCRPGTFGLDISNPEGCTACFCSGVTSECREANHYTKILVPAPIFGDNFGGYTIMDLNAESVYKESFVPVPDKSELMYTFNFPPNKDLYWSLPVFPGNRVLAYNGSLSLSQEFRSNTQDSSNPGTDVVLVGDGISVYWTNPQVIRSDEQMHYQVPLIERGWYILNSATPASRTDFMRVLKNLKRVLVRATIAYNLVSTSIADVSMETATETSQPDAPIAKGIEVCSCPPGHLGTSCESCAPRYYKDKQDYCQSCPCNGHDCELDAYDRVVCICQPPYTGSDCSAIGSESQMTTSRPSVPQSSVTIRITSPTIMIQEIGSSVNFTCQAQSPYTNQRLPLTWIKVNGELPQGRTYIDDYAGLLTITNLQISDSGEYICQTYDGLSTAQAKATLKVPTNDMTLPVVEIRPAVNEYYEGDRIELECIASGNPTPTIAWQRASRRPLPKSAEHIDYYFIIESAREEDSGEYRCIASNTAGSVDRTAVITVRSRPSRPPRDRLIVKPTAPTVNEGQSLRIVCTGSINVPTGTIDWIRRDGGRFQPNVRSDNGILIIENAILENQGIYICQTHAADVEPVQVVLDIIPQGTPSPDQLPEISVPVNSLKIPTGESNTIDCVPKGYPPPLIKWSKYQGEFGPGTSQRGNTLIIHNAQASDQGYYVCEGIVDNQTIQRVYVSLEIERREPPRVQIWPQGEQPVVLGSPFEFHCRVIAGIPEPDIMWSRSGGRTLSQHTDILPHNILKFESVDVNDEGEYICTASNLAGTDSASSVLKVRSPPVINITPTNYLEVNNGEPINIECRANGYPEPKVSITGPNQREIAPPTSGIAYLRIPAASDRDDGDYECTATSAAGTVKDNFIIKVDRGDGGFTDFGASGDNEIDTSNSYDPNYNPAYSRDAIVAVAGQNETVIYCQVPRGFTPVWGRADRQPLQSNARQIGERLIFYNVSQSDAGDYVCNVYDYVTNEAQQAAQTALRVVEPPRITLRPPTQTVLPGESPIVECVAQGDNIIDITWKPYRNSFSRRVSVRGPVLMFNRIEVEDAGKYVCVVRNQYTNISATAEVVVAGGDSPGSYDPNYDPNYNPNYNPEPQYPQQPSNLVATEGQRETPIYCDISSGYTPVWSRADGRPLQNNARQEGSRLVIYNASKRDSGEYVCSVYDQLNNEVQRAVHTTLLVVSAPKITLNPPNQTVLPGQSTTVECIVEGDNIIEVTWKPHNRNLPRRVRIRNNTLEFHQIEVEDAGEYECIARTPYANASATAGVVVAEESDMATSESHENEQHVHVGTAVMLSCNVTQPGLSVRWTKDGRSLPRSVRVKPDGSLYIKLTQKSDSGHYVCHIRDRYGRVSSNYVNLHIEGPPEETPNFVRIENPQRRFRVGENVKILCRNINQGRGTISASWEKWDQQGTRQYVESRTYGDGAMLIINGVTEADAGVYRCTGADNRGRSSYEDFNLEVEPGNPMNPWDRDATVANYTARLTQNIDMPCNHDLEEPVSIQWRREYAPLPADIRNDQPILRLTQVTESDAGTYVCRVSNNRAVVEAKAILRVVGVIPRFEGNGWVALPTLNDAFRQFDIEISFKPQEEDGLLLYNSQFDAYNGQPEKPDFIALHMLERIPEFILETGSGPVSVKGDRPLELGEWHTIRLSKIGSRVTMNVDNTGPFVNETKENWVLDLQEPLYVGGVQNYDNLPSQLAGTSGFVGCISMLILGREEKNIILNSLDKYEVFECDTCSPNLCLNNAVCQEALNERGYICLCPNGFAGANCERRGEACRPGLCGPGKCTDTADGYKCACPVTHTGKNCEIRQNIEYPAFTGSAYLALKPPNTYRFLKISMKVKPTAPVTDGIIMYCAESSRGLGGFTSLAVRNGRLEFRYDLGDGAPVVLVSNTTLPANEWTDVQVTRSGPTVSLNINMKQKYEQRLDSATKSLRLETPMFVGGVDESIILNNNTGVTSGFMGCIKHLKTSKGDPVDLVNSSIQSANVQECSNSDRGDIPEIESPCNCNNGGTCASDGTCICPAGFTGYNCGSRLPSTLRSSRRSQEPCAANPCRNGGTCKTSYTNNMNYSCDCPLGFSGASCQINLDLYQSVGFSGNGYLELPASLINYDNLDQDPVVIALAIHTTQDGVLVYQRQGVPQLDSGDFIMIRIERGYVVFEWDMGSGADRITVSDEEGFVTDGERHQIIVKMLSDGVMELTVDSNTVKGYTSGIAGTMHANSNIYIGGIPESLNYYKHPGLNGCIEQIEFMNAPRGLHLGVTAVAGRNTQRCKQ